MKQSVMELLDLRENGLQGMVDANIEKYRKGGFRIAVTDEKGDPVPGAELELELTNHEFRFGCNAFMTDGYDTPEKNARYRDWFRRCFNQAVVPFYWNADEPEEGLWRLEPGAPYIYRRPAAPDVLDFCRDVGAEPKGHNMLWFQMPPPWLETRPPAEIRRHILERFRRLSAFADRIPVWDVVNEHLARMLVYDFPERWPHVLPLDRGYVYEAFRLADRLFPGCTLIANEDTQRTWEDFHYDSSKYYLYLRSLRDAGCRVDGMGMQYHLFTREEELEEKRKHSAINAERIVAFMDFYGRMGIPMHVSEVTLPAYGGGAENLELQARMTDALYRLWFSGPMMRSIVWWNLSDGAASGGEDYFGGGLVDRELNAKPAMRVVEDLIRREWHTRLTLGTDARGFASGRGFYGTYRLKIRKGACTAEREFFFGTDSSPFIRVTV